ncbi:MAG: hypothetical protein Q8O83_02325 [bacterium]|nr:hypothetical protein [bacterium]
MKNKISLFSIIVFLLLPSFLIAHASETLCTFREKSVHVDLPNDFVEKINITVQYALDQKAAFAVSSLDLFHFHLLVPSTIENVQTILQNIRTGWTADTALWHIHTSTAMLLHSQENIKFKGYADRRNIFISFTNNVPVILDPAKYHKGPDDAYSIGILAFEGEYFYANQGCLLDITDIENAFAKEMRNTFTVMTQDGKRTILIRIPYKNNVI